ncbi:hypothetical protein BFJ66_g2307 [Fusarium oxysporum f. sp. cepae]|uniref:Uncharacterized protein n=1 Tax=Fusarium oxysporum f. sp. cepae TaxID=396571 RepID=A0A3L6P0D0_FUSOX|nr:hypothetical protein BFJ65_g2803 [Fusarium oxysporum f. sp. cepae]RKK56971.1 hypothetical protein BFJ67_g3516 [Fusarium oxysporum f. sp. cepae]RKK59304.1 hypothetical protein BFJ66_g2307 [Fusarium oxysporum f. sp. cepae]
MHAIDNLSPLCYHVGSAPALNTLKAYKSILSPENFLPFLQKVVRDPYVAWDIRSIEIWVDQLTWDFWDSSGSKSRKA